MDQLRKRFSTEQVRALLRGYCQGTLGRSVIEDILEISRTRFFALLTDLPALKPLLQVHFCS
jgi:hypothetical protein